MGRRNGYAAVSGSLVTGHCFSGHSRGFCGEPLPRGVERLWEDAGLAEDGHEVVVSIPARDEVAVQVRDAAAGGGAEIETDVNAVGLERQAKEAFAGRDDLKKVSAFSGRELFDVGDFPIRNGEQVAGVVRETIEHQIRQRGPVHDQCGAVVSQRGQFSEGALHVGKTRRLDVFHAPVGVKLLHDCEKKNAAKCEAEAKSKARLGSTFLFCPAVESDECRMGAGELRCYHRCRAETHPLRMANPPSFFRNHGLSLTMLGLFLGFLLGQILTGQRELNDEREKRGEPPFGVNDYLRSAHFFEATAENWESEFFQVFVYVFATSYLYQKGSAESKDPRKKHTHHRDVNKPVPPGAPWPVRRGGWVLYVYEHSLSLAFLLLFIRAFGLHVVGGQRNYNQERLADGESLLSAGEYLASSRFWFESFQNWQSEFLAIGSMVVLSIFLREKNSPESKQVETPHWTNEED